MSSGYRTPLRAGVDSDGVTVLAVLTFIDRVHGRSALDGVSSFRLEPPGREEEALEGCVYSGHEAPRGPVSRARPRGGPEPAPRGDGDRDVVRGRRLRQQGRNGSRRSGSSVGCRMPVRSEAWRARRLTDCQQDLPPHRRAMRSGSRPDVPIQRLAVRPLASVPTTDARRPAASTTSHHAGATGTELTQAPEMQVVPTEQSSFERHAMQASCTSSQ